MTGRTQLAWWPFDAVEWDNLIGECTVEEEGALLRMMRRAWRRPEPCTLDDGPAAFDAVGARAKVLTPFLRRFFLPDPARPGKLVSPWLRAKYDAQRERYERRAKPGALGGTMKQANRTLASEQDSLFNPRKRRRSNASSNASSSPPGHAAPPVAMLGQKLEGLLTTQTPPSPSGLDAPSTADEPEVSALWRWYDANPDVQADVALRAAQRLAAAQAENPQADTRLLAPTARVIALREAWRASRAPVVAPAIAGGQLTGGNIPNPP